MIELTPRQIVAELDKHIVGQDDAKRAVAIAVRNRWRHQRVDETMRKEIGPKNIMMIGPTGVGKTEIARRLAVLTDSPFIKVEATKYTEVGYYGRDVESMVRELVENAIGIIRAKERETVLEEAKRRVEEQLLDMLLPPPPQSPTRFSEFPDRDRGQTAEAEDDCRHKYQRNREKMKAMLLAGELDDRTVSITSESKGSPVMMGMIPGMDNIETDLSEMFERFMPKNRSQRELSVRDARGVLLEQECDALINKEKVNARAIELAETAGIIFIDEIDKIVASEKQHGADVSRQGVQRDLLPIVEGTTIQTKYGYVRTDHILFVAAGAFHRAKPSDLMPELQGRFPIRVELSDLTKDDFVRILTEPSGSLTKQYVALMDTENVRLVFENDAIEELARYAFEVNQRSQNIGARRLYTIMERMLEELSFEAPETRGVRVVVNAAYVKQRLDDIAADEELNKFIL
ncbi:MAG TPA: HslU--HslV peptidase ATPase subunit [Planctomycetaceae bacterium]|nr:HslU--HslV peptidase ATPase subunit [Planctomycetaceae bacterium]